MLTSDKLHQLLEELPERRPRSKLLPYGELIAEMRFRNYSYREISRFLAEQCGVHITHNAVRNYVKQHCPESHNPVTNPESAVQDRSIADRPSTVSEGNPQRREEMEAVRERIAALKTRRHSGKAEGTGFRFDPTQPLRLTGEE